jgi:triphosphoribosyl-dephospho-CoA synthase
MIPGLDEIERGDWWYRPLRIGALVELTCVIEASAPKPGNVSPERPFADTTYEDFVASAAAIREPFNGAATRRVGETIRLAAEATSRCTGANTNLGIILLLAPLAKAAVGFVRMHDPTREQDLQSLRSELEELLGETTVSDAVDVYQAIRIARPGGLGGADEQDVRDEPTVTLLEAMRLAADRDGIAREYATAFATTFETGVPALMRARAAGLAWRDAVVETFLTLVAAAPDTHIERRGGKRLALEVSRMAQEALAAGGVRSEAGRRLVDAMDGKLRDPRNLGNPGTSADLTAAAIFVTMVVGGWRPRGDVRAADVHSVTGTVGG